MSFVSVLTLLVVCQVDLVVCYSSGAPAGSCTTLNPSGHGASTATGVAPYNLSLSRNTYSPGDTIQVTLSGLNGASFKGFLITAKRLSGQTDNIGNFTATAVSKSTCAQSLGNGVTHSDSSIKTSVSFNWTAPPTPVGDLVFYYTVVRGLAPGNRQDFFQNITSGTLKASSTPVTSFNKNTECGLTRSCFSDCQNGVCDWEITWKNAGLHYQINMKAVVASNSTYIALGFNNISSMSPASVVSCMLYNGQVTVSASFNSAKSNRLLANPKEGISNESNSYNNGLLECSFSRASVSSNTQVFNLTQPWYIITAKGLLNASGALLYHGHQNHFVTRTMIDLSNSTTDYTVPSIASTTNTGTTGTTGTTNQPGIKKFAKDLDCGITKGCYSNCKKNSCDLLLSWKDLGSKFEISLESIFPNANNFIALGFSDANKMNPASVLGCAVYQGSVGVYASFNQYYYNQQLPNVRYVQPLEGLSNITGSYTDGILSCTAFRVTESNNTQIYSLRNKWYLITSRGEVEQNGVIPGHKQTDAFFTPSRLDFTDPTVDISLDEQDFSLVKAHGCLMVIAWMLIASLGLAMARFCKKLWPDTTICDVKIWFAVHRTAMVMVFLIGISAFIIIFIYIDGYSKITGETYKKAHPILGIIVTSLLFINPFMSLLRCAPNHPRRPIFNWAHWLVGSSAHILGGVTIGIGLYLPKANLDSNKGLIIIIIYGSWHIAFFLIMTLIDYLSGSRSSKTAVATTGQPLQLADVQPQPLGKNPYNLVISDSQKDLGQLSNVNSGLQNKNSEPPLSNLKKLLMLAHIIVLLGLTVSMMYLIITGDI